MNKDTFEKVCETARSGKNSYVAHPSSGEEGRIVSCTEKDLVVNTGLGHRRTWDYHECSQISAFGKSKIR